MSYLVTLPNFLWTIKDLSAAHKFCSPVLTFMGMKWKLTFTHLPDIYTATEGTIQLILKRLSPVPNSQAEELRFYVFTSITVNHAELPKMQKTSYATLSYQHWCIWSSTVKDIKSHYGNFKMNSVVTFFISVNLFNGSSQLLDLIHKIEQQATRIPLCVKTLSVDLEQLFLSEKHNDVVLKCQDKSFRAHKAILSARSEVFDAMFRSDMKETREGIIHITDMEPSILEQFLRYLYTGHISDLSADSARKIHAAADKYRVEALTVKCALFVAKKYTQSNEPNSCEIRKKDTETQSEEIPTEGKNEARGKELQKLTDKEKLLKELFLTLEWKTLAERYPKLASEMCRPLLSKEVL